MSPVAELSADRLRSQCDPNGFQFQSTADIEPLDAVIGQERAVKAIEFGLAMDGAGYHIFVTGLPGTGKKTIIQDLVRRHAAQQKAPSDWCMVNNFTDAYRPLAIRVPPGKALVFAKRIGRLVEDLRKRIPHQLEGEAFSEKQNEIVAEHEQKKKALFEAVNESAKAKNLAIGQNASGYQSIPMVDGEPLSREAFLQLSETQQATLAEAMEVVNAELETALKEIHKVQLEKQSAIDALMGQAALFVVRDRLRLVREEYKGWPDIHGFLNTIQADMVENVQGFLPVEQTAPEEMVKADGAEAFFGRYAVNPLVEHPQDTGAPVVFEPNPTYTNLFGNIEKKAVMGMLTTDFTMIQAGALLQANGGYLILEIEPLLHHPHVWDALKRALQNQQLQIEDPASWSGMGRASLRPEPIQLDVKLILMGSFGVFHMLQGMDSKFNKIFKVRADFDHEVNCTDECVQHYAAFIARVCQEEELLHFGADAVAEVVEYGKRLAANHDKLSLRFGAVVDILKEADHWAGNSEADQVTGTHVQQAVEEIRYRNSLMEEKVQERYEEETILIDVKGAEVGQVNALAVYQVGDVAFGRPSRITAETYMGRPGVINIEREAELSGRTHDKGVMILNGYLGRTFAQKAPLTLAISIAFEQSYEGIDGDSASSTELYAILSSLSGYPIRQGIAVTGSVNQKGQIQAIGGVNHKIEGFYDVCCSKTMTGRQGVIIPQANVRHLMLRQDVVDAVAAGRFHIYPLTTVEEGIEVLTGHPAGKRNRQGNFPAKSVYGQVQRKLDRFLEQSQQLPATFWR